MKRIENFKKKELIVMYLQTLIDTKKIITANIKKQLIAFGFEEVVIGTRNEHEIKSKNFKLNFYGHDIAIGLSPIPISYGSNRKYIALVYNFKS
ncbi:hypothetical protein [Haploplasma modicum]|uniref:hypothetical protein n=1 Tax=Haploplasma modicum TaxID=2150 RepID=UPI00138B0AC7|nr:hypothetical protein [Haploplasma modicum]